MGAIRGAICAENSIQDIENKSLELVNLILETNNIGCGDIEAVFFSVTKDLDAAYPAKAVRENLSMDNVAFMCFTEMHVLNSLDHCIRVCVISPKINQKLCKHCYVGRAKILRDDLSS